ncbi:MAG: DUF3168 domain-containing protein [Hyphomicrobiales bacterium]|nr:DUF3168 domain-containing protein [Hyphomicrobiales bacterium]
MSAAASLALRSAVRDALLAEAALTTRLGGNRIYDEAPGNIEPPYVTFGDVRIRDWSTSSDRGSAHTLTIEAWSKHHGLQECLEIAALIEAALETPPPAPGLNIVLLRVESMETARRDKGRLALARMRLSALVEPV